MPNKNLNRFSSISIFQIFTCPITAKPMRAISPSPLMVVAVVEELLLLDTLRPTETKMHKLMLNQKTTSIRKNNELKLMQDL
jgi:hypothetical protein